MKENFLNLSLLIFSVFFALFILEVGFRLYGGIMNSEEGWTYQFANFRNRWIGLEKRKDPTDFDPELGWVPKPGLWADGITILDDGIRSNCSVGVLDPTGAVLAVGDSFTFGAGTSDCETWPAQLEQVTGRRIINGGVAGYGIDQTLLRTRRLLSRYRVSSVIFSFIPDDIARCALSERGAGKPYFNFEDGRLALKNVPVPAPLPPPKESKLFIALEHSLLVHAIMKRWYPEWWTSQGFRWTRVHDEQKGVEVACALLHELEGLAQTRRFQLIVLVQRAERETLSESMAVESVLGCLSDPATRVLDLKSALSELKAKHPSKYHSLFFWHMTAEGNRFVAAEISKFMTQRRTRLDQTASPTQ